MGPYRRHHGVFEVVVTAFQQGVRCASLTLPAPHVPSPASVAPALLLLARLALGDIDPASLVTSRLHEGRLGSGSDIMPLENTMVLEQMTTSARIRQFLEIPFADMILPVASVFLASTRLSATEEIYANGVGASVSQRSTTGDVTLSRTSLDLTAIEEFTPLAV